MENTTKCGSELVRDFRREALNLITLIRTLENTIREELKESPIFKKWSADYPCEDEECDIAKIYKERNLPSAHYHSAINGISDPSIAISGLDQNDLGRPYWFIIGVYFPVSPYRYPQEALEKLREIYSDELNAIREKYNLDICTFVHGSPI